MLKRQKYDVHSREMTTNGWLIMIGGLVMAAVVAVFIDGWDRHVRRKRHDEAAKLRVERAEKARNNPPTYDDDEISR